MGERVVVIGGGIIGLCSAYYLSRAGYSVTVIDRHSSEHHNCSYGNAGMVVPSHFIPLAAPGAVALGLKWMFNPDAPFYVKPRLDFEFFDWAFKFWRSSSAVHVNRSAPLIRDLSFASRCCFEEMAATLPDFGFTKKGLLMLCKTQPAFEHESKMAEQATALGVPAQILSGKETAALEPNVRMNIAGSVYFPKDCHLSPALMMAALKADLQRRGVTFIWQSEVEGFASTGMRVDAVRFGKEDLPADHVVIAGGVWSASLAKTIGAKLPMQAGKGYSVTLPNPRQLPGICSILSEARIAVTPMGSALRFCGTMEMAGLDESINHRRVRAIVNAIPNYFPEFQTPDFDGLKPWAGLRPCSPDGLPYIGRARRYENVCLATGHAMMGLSLSPITGKLVSELVGGVKPSLEIGLLDPYRY